MKATGNTSKILELSFLWEISKALNSTSNSVEITSGIKRVFDSFLCLSDLKILIYEPKNRYIKDFSKSWTILESVEEQKYSQIIRECFKYFEDGGFLFNNKVASINDKNFDAQALLTDKYNNIILPVIQKNSVIGLIDIEFSAIRDNIMLNDYIVSLNIAASQISASVINSILNEQMQVSIDFHNSMKNIAKIIETQYELSYIIPIVGEMIDKFISEHLIYIFIKNDHGEFELIWPSYCNKTKFDQLFAAITPEKTFAVSTEKNTGAFGLIADNNVLGVIVASSPHNKLSDEEINYLQQLSQQTSITINRANTYAEILKHATMDALTGLNNRRQFENRLKQEISTAQRKTSPLCCIMLDIDYFKSINDSYGHSVGDKVLKDISKIIVDELRVSDIAARYGGEEFVILLPSTGLEEASQVAERLRSAVSLTKFDISEMEIKDVKTLTTSISVGVSAYSPDFSDNSILYKNADKALYKAKQTGRDRVVVYNIEENMDFMNSEKCICDNL